MSCGNCGPGMTCIRCAPPTPSERDLIVAQLMSIIENELGNHPTAAREVRKAAALLSESGERLLPGQNIGNPGTLPPSAYTDKEHSATPRTDEQERIHGKSPLAANHAWGWARLLEQQANGMRSAVAASLAPCQRCGHPAKKVGFYVEDRQAVDVRCTNFPACENSTVSTHVKDWPTVQSASAALGDRVSVGDLDCIRAKSDGRCAFPHCLCPPLRATDRTISEENK